MTFSDDPIESADLPPVPDDEDLLVDDGQVESAMRWRLVLGRFSDDRLAMDRFEERIEDDDDLSSLLTQSRRMVTLHAVIGDEADNNAVVQGVKGRLKDKFNLDHATVEIECRACADTTDEPHRATS